MICNKVKGKMLRNVTGDDLIGEMIDEKSMKKMVRI